MADTPLFITSLRDRKKWHDYRQGIWGNSYTWAWERSTTDIRSLVIHHTVTDHDETPDYIAALHRARKWAGIGYHFVITKDGIVHYVGDVSTARANVLKMNEKVIGIALIGDFTKFNPSDEQILSAHDLCKFFIEQPNWPNVNSWENVLVGHKELQNTACPGTYWKGVADSMFERIKNRIPYSPQEEPPEDWEAKYKTELAAHEGTQGTLTEMREMVKILGGEKDVLNRRIKEMKDYSEEAHQAETDRDNLWAHIASTVGWNRGWYDTSKEERKTVLAAFSSTMEDGKQAVVELKTLQKDLGKVRWQSLVWAGIRKFLGKEVKYG